MKLKWVVKVCLVLSAVGVVVFQNCAPHKFTTETLALSSTGILQSCNESERPVSEISTSCPAGSTGVGVTRTRNVVCSGEDFVVGSWTNPDYSSCSCLIPGQTIHSLTGVCACPAGQEVRNNSCTTVAASCDPSQRPSDVEFGICPAGSTGSTMRTRTVTCPVGVQYQVSAWSIWDSSQCIPTVITPTCLGTKPPTQETISCPTGLGTATRSRTVSCPTGATVWVINSWMNNYAGCLCPATGQVLNSMTGTCACPSGQAVVGNSCQVPSCSLATKPSESESISCPSGSSGNATRTRIASCPAGSTQWSTTAWTSNYSTCNCSVVGQTANPQTGVCACPTGQTIINGACKVPACDPATKQALNQSGLACPNNSTGTYSRSRPEPTCNTSTYTYTYANWTANYSTCSCAAQGQTFNPSTLTCECPSGQVVSGGMCVTPAPSCPQPGPASRIYTSCPSGIGQAYQDRSVFCPTGSTQWSIGAGAWNYSSCGCSVIGAQVNPTNGSCSCISGTYEISGQCGVCPATMTYDASTRTCKPKTCSHPDNGSQVAIGSAYTYYTVSTANSQAACDSSRVTVNCTTSGTWSGGISATRYGSCTPVVPPPPPTCPSSKAIGWAGGNVATNPVPGPGVLPNGNEWCYYQVWHNGDLFCASVDKTNGQTHKEGKCCGGYGTNPYMAAKYGSDCKAFNPCTSNIFGGGVNSCAYGLTKTVTKWAMDPSTGQNYEANYTCSGAPGDVFQCQGYAPYVPVDYGGGGD